MIQMIRRIFEYLIQSDTLQQGVFPTSADGVAAAAITLTKNAAAWTWGAWTQIVLAAGVTTETQIVGFSLENFVGAPAQGEVEVGFGTAPAGTAVGRFQTALGNYLLPRPIRVQAGIGLVARYRAATAIADTVDIKLNTLTGF